MDLHAHITLIILSVLFSALSVFLVVVVLRYSRQYRCISAWEIFPWIFGICFAGVIVYLWHWLLTEEQLLHIAAAVLRATIISGVVAVGLLSFSIYFLLMILRRNQKIAHQSTYDILTDLPNRMLLLDRLSQAIVYAKNNLAQPTIFFLNLDRFKLINHSLGHAAGDQLLQSVARRFSHLFTSQVTVSRWSGDEFIFLFPNLAYHDIADRARTCLNTLTKPYQLGNSAITISASMGISIYPKEGDTPETLLKQAAIAMRRAKSQGGSQFQFFAENMNADFLRRLQLEEALRSAITENQLVLYYHPVVNLQTQKIHCIEVLVRWQHPKEGLISPTDFIMIAEETGLIVEMGEWILKTACLQNYQWQQNGLQKVPIAVNVTALQFQQENFVQCVQEILLETKLAPQFLELEIIERGLMDNPQKAVNVLEQLRELGVSLSIDDFGTGYSSLSYLKEFPVKKLKIDQSFISGLPDHQKNLSIVRSVIALAKELDLQVVAEGVEYAAQADILRHSGCDMAQGYYFGKPLDNLSMGVMLQHE